MNPETPTFRIAFMLLPRFSSLTLSSLVEPLRIANYCAAEQLYQWQFVSADGNPVVTSTDIEVPTTAIAGSGTPAWDAIIICGGWNTERYADDEVLRWLRLAGRRGVLLGAVETGSYVLAQAGLLSGYQATIHWHCHGAFAERFTDVQLVDQLYVIDRKRMTCAGGTACLDMMLHEIEQRHGAALAEEVAGQVLYPAQREACLPQKQPRQRSHAGVPQSLQSAIEIMEHNIEEPLAIPELAAQISLSQRKLERLFNKYLGCSAVAYYRVVRLQQARVLLTHTDMSVLDICITCGFSSSSYFSKSYTDQFGVRPRDHRTSWPESEPSPNWPGTSLSRLPMVNAP